MFNFLICSIHRKFMAILVSTLIIVNMPLLIFFYNLSLEAKTREIKIKSEATLNANAMVLSQPLWDFDYSSITRWAKIILDEDNVSKVMVFDDQNKLLTNLTSKDNHDTSSLGYTKMREPVFHEVKGKLSKVGTLEIHFFQERYNFEVLTEALEMLFVLIASITSVIVAAIFANRYIIAEPLRRLTRAINAAHDGGKPVIIDTISGDEIGHVTQNFNDLQKKLINEQSRIEIAYEKLTALYHDTPALLYSLDEEGYIRAISDYWLKATGYETDEVIGLKFIDFLSSCSLEAYQNRQDDNNLAYGQFSEISCLFRKKNGSYIDVLIRGVSYKDHNTDAFSLCVMTDISTLKQAEEALRVQAETDSLTGLLNRDGFIIRVNKLIDEAANKGKNTAVLFLDLDRFKWVNDNLGHSAGDQLLKEVSEVLRKTCGRCSCIARFGGDEFSVMIQGTNLHGRVEKLAERFLKKLAKPINIQGHEINVSATIGIAVCPPGCDDTAVDIIKSADVAMYHQKKIGRNNYCFFNDSLGRDAGRHLEMSQLIERALVNDWFELHLQPIIDLQSNKIYGFEALLRLNHPERGLISPAQIIETAEQTNQILDIGDRVIDLSIARLIQLKEIPHLKDCYLSCNLSAAQFLPNLPTKLASKLMQNNIQPSQLVLEITETVLMQNSDNLVSIFEAIHKLGCRFAVDDFGTGYSSLSYLNEFPVDLIKIDQSFVFAMMNHEKDPKQAKKTETLVSGILAISHELGLSVVAEGIENADVASQLKRMGVDYGQGYHFSKPMPLEHFDKNEASLLEKVG